jgi:hypothetical protein
MNPAARELPLAEAGWTGGLEVTAVAVRKGAITGWSVRLG